MHEISLADVPGLVGEEIGTSDWITVEQSMIDQFADATLDHQFIHVDPERALAESPFGGNEL
jgi:acyl dehydratase